MSHPYEGLQQFVQQLPDFLHPLIVALLGTIPYVEGEGSAGLGVLVGINPVVAGIAGATGNILSVLAVVFLGARIRRAVVARRAARRAAPERLLVPAGNVADQPGEHADADRTENRKRSTKGRKRLQAWLVRFGVPGASILAPLALPTQLTAAFFVASGVSRGWVVLWQVVAIVLWTGLVTVAATGLLSLLGW